MLTYEMCGRSRLTVENGDCGEAMEKQRFGEA